MAVVDLRIVNISRYLFPWPPSEHTLNWEFFSHISKRLQRLFLIATVPGRDFRTFRSGKIDFYGIPADGPKIMSIPRFLITAQRHGDQLLRRGEADAVWASDDLWGNLIASRLSSRYDVPFLLELQGNVFSPSEEAVSKPKRAIQKTIVTHGVRGASIVRLCCDAHLKRLDMYGGANKGAVVPTRVDLDLFDSARLDPMAIRQELGVTEREIILVTVSSLVSRKGIQVALDAIEALLAENELFRYWIVGDGPLRAAFEQRVDPLGDRVRFLGRLPHREVSRILAGADIFVFPSFAEGMPRAVHEAMAMRLPVVASAVDGIPEQVVNGTTGYLVPPGDAGALAGAIRRLEDAGTRRQMGEAGREHVRRHYNQPVVLSKWVEVLERLADCRS